jgi:hypothetical protein
MRLNKKVAVVAGGGDRGDGAAHPSSRVREADARVPLRHRGARRPPVPCVGDRDTQCRHDGERRHTGLHAPLPSELSGGEQQRVAIAGALVSEPALVLADEPTGNLDSHTTVEVMALFQQLNDQGITMVVVTHEPDVAAYATRIVEMGDGQILRDRPVASRHRAARDLEESNRSAA